MWANFEPGVGRCWPDFLGDILGQLEVVCGLDSWIMGELPYRSGEVPQYVPATDYAGAFRRGRRSYIRVRGLVGTTSARSRSFSHIARALSLRQVRPLSLPGRHLASLPVEQRNLIEVTEFVPADQLGPVALTAYCFAQGATQQWVGPGGAEIKAPTRHL